MRTDEEILAFSQTVPGYYDLDELQNLLRLVRTLPSDATIVEIGVEYGRSASIYLQCPENWANLHLIDARTHNAESGRKSTEDLLYQFPNSQAVHCREGWTSEDAANDWYYGSIDLIHIDADHTASGVETDLRRWADRVKVGGYIVFHDYNRPDGKGGVVFPDYTLAISNWIIGQSRIYDKLNTDSALYQWEQRSFVNTQLVLKRNF